MVGVPNSIDPQPHNSTFWKALPGGKGLFWPMFVVATLAAIVASQALISAVRYCTFLSSVFIVRICLLFWLQHGLLLCPLCASILCAKTIQATRYRND